MGTLGLGDRVNRNLPQFLFNKDDISIFIAGGKRKKFWTPESHKMYSHAFQQGVLTFVLCLYRARIVMKLSKLPKYILFEILKSVSSFKAPESSKEKLYEHPKTEEKCIIF